MSFQVSKSIIKLNDTISAYLIASNVFFFENDFRNVLMFYYKNGIPEPFMNVFTYFKNFFRKNIDNSDDVNDIHPIAKRERPGIKSEKEKVGTRKKIKKIEIIEPFCDTTENFIKKAICKGKRKMKKYLKTKGKPNFDIDKLRIERARRIMGSDIEYKRFVTLEFESVYGDHSNVFQNKKQNRVYQMNRNLFSPDIKHDHFKNYIKEEVDCVECLEFDVLAELRKEFANKVDAAFFTLFEEMGKMKHPLFKIRHKPTCDLIMDIRNIIIDVCEEFGIVHISVFFPEGPKKTQDDEYIERTVKLNGFGVPIIEFRPELKIDIEDSLRPEINEFNPKIRDKFLIRQYEKTCGLYYKKRKYPEFSEEDYPDTLTCWNNHCPFLKSLHFLLKNHGWPDNVDFHSMNHYNLKNGKREFQCKCKEEKNNESFCFTNEYRDQYKRLKIENNRLKQDIYEAMNPDYEFLPRDENNNRYVPEKVLKKREKKWEAKKEILMKKYFIWPTRLHAQKQIEKEYDREQAGVKTLSKEEIRIQRQSIEDADIKLRSQVFYESNPDDVYIDEYDLNSDMPNIFKKPNRKPFTGKEYENFLYYRLVTDDPIKNEKIRQKILKLNGSLEFEQYLKENASEYYNSTKVNNLENIFGINQNDLSNTIKNQNKTDNKQLNSFENHTHYLKANNSVQSKITIEDKPHVHFKDVGLITERRIDNSDNTNSHNDNISNSSKSTISQNNDISFDKQNSSQIITPQVTTQYSNDNFMFSMDSIKQKNKILNDTKDIQSTNSEINNSFNHNKEIDNNSKNKFFMLPNNYNSSNHTKSTISPFNSSTLNSQNQSIETNSYLLQNMNNRKINTSGFPNFFASQNQNKEQQKNDTDSISLNNNQNTNQSNIQNSIFALKRKKP